MQGHATKQGHGITLPAPMTVAGETVNSAQHTVLLRLCDSWTVHLAPFHHSVGCAWWRRQQGRSSEASSAAPAFLPAAPLPQVTDRKAGVCTLCK